MKKNIIRIASVLLAVYLAYFFSGIVIPRLQLFFDMEELSANGTVAFYRYNLGKEIVAPDESGLYKYSLDYAGNKYEVAIEIGEDNDILCRINGIESDCIPISEYTSNMFYANTYCIPVRDFLPLRYFVFIQLSIVLIAVFLLASREVIDNNGKYTGIFTFSNSAYRYLGKKPVIVSFLVAALSLVLYIGCDLTVISETIILHEKGIDIYQLFAALNKDKGVELFMWQYNGAMLAGYNLWSRLFYPLLQWYNPSAGYHWIQVIEYKTFNMILCNLLVLSIISFLIDSDLLDKGKVKRVYYFSVFNPLSFYVAIWFIQFDILPAYLITLAVLLMFRKDNKVMAAILLAFGLATKDTMLFFIPTILVAFILFALKEVKQRKNNILFILLFIILYGEMYVIPKVLDTPIARAFHKLPQAQRAWWTTITYIDNAVYLYLSIFMLVLCFVLGVYSYRMSIKNENIIRNVIYVMAAIVCAFSFSILPTPAFYILTTGAFVLLYADSEDLFQSFICAFLGVIMASAYMFAREGDITASLRFVGLTPLFTLIGDKMNAIGEGVKWISILHTISQAGMFCFFIIFMRKANDVITLPSCRKLHSNRE
ncbi:hypothetical protein [Butyrivibrio sp. AD3002]|uniref:hypothetical protein n=1 Tax=Butyrivibrio sp. AD3002 TaxID=1280670 RepID=UPI0003B6A3FB|nr:hypothetical protein [Butyrivibrio sp. AD3002]